ncbi:uncharacterized protein LOC144160521 isoform X1 [Haemaphysalis longicornis]
MVVLSNVLLILASLAGLTTAGIFDGLFKSTGSKNSSAIGGAFGAALGEGILGGLFQGIRRGQRPERVDPGLASVLASFGQEFDEKPGTSTASTGEGVGSASTTAGAVGSKGEQESSEEKPKPSNTNVRATASAASPPEKPVNAAPGVSTPETPAQSTLRQPGLQTPVEPAAGQSGSETPGQPASGVPGSAGNAGTEVARKVGAAAGAALASTVLQAIFTAIQKKRESQKKKNGPQEQPGPRREKRSLVDEVGPKGSKGALKGLNNLPDLSNSFYCGRHEMPNTVGARDRFCHPSSTWNTTMRLLPECVCQPGFLRNSWGACISARECNQCRSKHRLNMDYHLCGSPCPIVCNQPVNEYCPNTCVRKCACRPGYIRKYPNGPCVSIKQCLPACRGRNQIFSLCSSLCPPTCRRPVPKRCPKVCAGEGCVCKPGFVVKKWEPLICVRPERCPGRRKKCKGPNQVYTRCRRRCAPSCFTRRHRYCGKGCIGRGCVCKRGFVVLQWRPLVCVRRNQCPARRKKCPAKNQIYKYCKSKCPPTCADKKPRKCGSACAGEGCACKPGFVIKQQNPLVCVRRFRCRSIKKRLNRGNGRRVPHPDDLLPWSSMPN